MPKFFARVAALLAIASALGTGAWAQAPANALAAKYVDLRQDIIQNGNRLSGAPAGPGGREALALIARDLARGLKGSSDWGPSHPNWNRVVETIRQDLFNLLERVEKDPAVHALQEDVRTRLIVEIQGRHSENDLRQILGFYDSPSGRHFLRQQARMTELLTDGIAETQRLMSRGGRPIPDPQTDQASFTELLTLFDEMVRGLWALNDPGPGKDQSGLQAIPMMVMAGVQIKFKELSALWRDLTADERRVVLAYRSSDLGVKERTVLFEAMGKIKDSLKSSGFWDQLEQRSGELEKKWQGLVPN